MKACLIDGFGGCDKLMFTVIGEPALREGEVLVAIKAAGVNPVDAEIRRGLYKRRIPYRLPLIPGWDMAGVVAATGYGAKRFKAGDEVYACCRRPVLQYGTYAEYISLPECYLARRPRNVSFCEAAAIPLAGLAAYQGLYEVGRLKKGAEVFILGAAGDAGGFAVQLARLAEAHVCALAGEEEQAWLRSLGADETIALTAADFRPAFNRLVPQGADLVLDCLGGDVLARAYSCLKPGATLVSLVERGGDLYSLREKNINFYYLLASPNAVQLAHIGRLVEAEQVQVCLKAVFPLADAARAHAGLEAGLAAGLEGRRRGKIVLEV